MVDVLPSAHLSHILSFHIVPFLVSSCPLASRMLVSIVTMSAVPDTQCTEDHGVSNNPVYCEIVQCIVKHLPCIYWDTDQACDPIGWWHGNHSITDC